MSDALERQLARERAARREAERIGEQALSEMHQVSSELELLRSAAVVCATALTLDEMIGAVLRAVIAGSPAGAALVTVHGDAEAPAAEHLGVPLVGWEELPPQVVVGDAAEAAVSRSWAQEDVAATVAVTDERLVAAGIACALVAPLGGISEGLGRVTLYLHTANPSEKDAETLMHIGMLMGLGVRRIRGLHRVQYLEDRLTRSVARLGSRQMAGSDGGGQPVSVVEEAIIDVRGHLVDITSEMDVRANEHAMTSASAALIRNGEVLRAAAQASGATHTEGELAAVVAVAIDDDVVKAGGAVVIGPAVGAGAAMRTSTVAIAWAARRFVKWALGCAPDGPAVVVAGRHDDAESTVVTIRSEVEGVAAVPQEIVGEIEMLVAPVDIRLECDVREGFAVCELAVVSLAAAPAAGGRPASPMLRRLDQRVLVVEDNEINQHVITQQLEALSCTPVVAGNTTDMWGCLHETSFDAILMDCELGTESGLDATEAIRAQNVLDRSGEPVRVIAITAHAFDEQRDACMRAGMNAFLAKPLGINDLRGALEDDASLSLRGG